MKIFGTIRNSKNQDPIKGANIKFSIEGTEITSVISNEQGEYEYATEEDHIGQTLDFAIQKEGFERKNLSYEIDKAEIKSDILLNELEKETKEKTRIFGTIRNSKNRDLVKDASITLSIEGTQIAVITSDELGGYKYTADEDYTGQTLDYVIKKEGFIRKDISHEIERFEIESDILMDEIEIKIKGKICDETDSPLDNASVSFSIGGSTIDLVSDKDGSFSFTVGQQFLNQTIGYEANKKGFEIKSGKLKLLEILKCINLSKSIPPEVPDKSKWIQIIQEKIGLIGLIVLTGLAIYLFLSPSGPGSIYATSTPSGASIYLDGSNVGITPKTISEVSAGSHTIKITKSGYEDYNTQVTVTAKETKTVIADLVEQPGSIDVSSIPSGASIYIDGSNVGITPKTISEVSAGSHTIKITKSGYEDYNTQVTVTAGKRTDVFVNLETIPANNFEGLWVNENSNTGDNTKLEITQKGNQLSVHAWGACSPTDCDWGTESGSINGDTAIVIWDQGFVLREMKLTLIEPNRLYVETYSNYVDSRASRTSMEYFKRSAYL